MTFHIRFSEQAIETYDALREQLKISWGDKYVDVFTSKTAKCLALISQSPYLFAIYNQTTSMRRCVIHKNFSVLYVVEEPDVVIICFWDNRQDPIFMDYDM